MRRSKLTGFNVRLIGPDETDLQIHLDGKYVNRGKRVQLRGLQLPATGTYRLEVMSEGTGDYSLVMRALAAPKLQTTLTDVEPGKDRDVEFAAPANSKLTVIAKRPRGSAAEPRVDVIAEEDTSAQGRLKPAAHSVPGKVFADGGDSIVTISNQGADAGDIAVTIQVRAPRVKPQRLDLRGRTFGAPEGGETVRVRTVDQAGATISIDDDSSAIARTVVDIPAGALPNPVAITVGTSEPLTPPDPADNQQAGPAVKFGPDGTKFGGDGATITLPFNPDALPLGSDPQNDLKILRVSGKTSQVITPTSVDQEENTVTFPTPGFSTFMAFAPRGAPDLNGSSYWALSFEADFVEDALSQGNSTIRATYLVMGEVNFGPQSMPGSLANQLLEREVTFDHDANGEGSVTSTEVSFTESGSWSYQSNEERIDAVFPGEDTDVLLPSGDGSIVLTDIGAGNDAGIDLLIRKDDEPPTLTSLAGTYWIAYFEVAGFATGSFSPLVVSFDRAFGTMTVRTDGTCTLDVSSRVAFFNAGPRVYETERDNAVSQGTVSFAPSNEGPNGIFGDLPIITLPARPLPGQTGEFLVLPGADGNVIAMTDRQQYDNGSFMMVGVRQSTNASIAGLDELDNRTLDLAPNTYLALGNQSLVPDFEILSSSQTIVFSGSRAAFDEGREHIIHRDPGSVPGGVFTTSDPVTGGGSARFTLAKNGRFTADAFLGAMAPGLQFGMGLNNPSSPDESVGIGLFVTPPPGTDD